MYEVGRPINGISLNGLEFLLESEGGNIKLFDTYEAAESFLRDAGFDDEDLDWIVIREHVPDIPYTDGGR